jgi:hypothetical protein
MSVLFPLAVSPSSAIVCPGRASIDTESKTAWPEEYPNDTFSKRTWPSMFSRGRAFGASRTSESASITSKTRCAAELARDP